MTWFSRFFKPHRRAPQVISLRYAASGVDRLTEDWQPSDWSPNLLIQNGLSRLRSRARDLERDNPYIRRFLQMMEANVIGHRGFTFQSLVKDANGNPDKVARERLEAAWHDFSMRQTASADGYASFRKLTQTVLRRVLVDGECFVRRLRGPENRFGITYQIIEPDAVDETLNCPVGRSAPEVRMGIELDALRRPVAYHIRMLDDYGATGRPVRIPAADIFHVYIRERPSQVRGVTWMASTMLRMKMLDAYEHAAVIAARAAAAKMGFLVPSEDYQGEAPGANDPTVMNAEPGAIEKLPVGLKFESWDPAYPPTGFSEFESEIKRGFASGLGVSYVTLANNLEGVSYSSIRQGALEDRDFYRAVQQELIEQWAEPAFAEWLVMALTAGAVDLPLAKIEKFRAHKWVPRGWGWVDPLKEIQALREEIALNLTTRGRAAAENGEDIEDVFADVEREGVLAAQHNINLDLQPKAPAKAEKPTDEDDDEEADE